MTAKESEDTQSGNRHAKVAAMDAQEAAGQAAKRRKVEEKSMPEVDNTKISEANAKADIGEEPRMEAPQPFYHVRARNSCDSPDPRAKRERMLVEMSYRIRDYPTLPAHPDDSNEVWDAALAEDMAVELPQVHCSFRGSPWCCLLYTSPSPRDGLLSRMPSSA